MRKMNLTLHVWRQPNAQSEGRFIEYAAPDINEHMSFLEMLDVVNERLIEKGEDPIAFDHACFVAKSHAWPWIGLCCRISTQVASSGVSAVRLTSANAYRPVKSVGVRVRMPIMSIHRPAARNALRRQPRKAKNSISVPTTSSPSG